ncbi:MAG: glycosyltransferase family protein [Candidatus Binataceae bacterium]
MLGSASLANYQNGGGHWAWFLQYPLGLRALGHEVKWLEIMRPMGDADVERAAISGFFARASEFGLDRDCILIVARAAVHDLTQAEVYGATAADVRELSRDADLLWNLAAGIREPILSMFRRSILIDVDPGHLQLAALACDLDLASHHAFLTAGGKINHPDCLVPRLGHEWRTFHPFVHLPLWTAAPGAGKAAPISSVTHWTWELLPYEGRLVSASKRTAYLRYLELPLRTRRPFTLAANIGESDPVSDTALLASYGWTVVDPHRIAASPADYQSFIRASRAEFQCPKPVFREFRTGWISDRSAAYLASGRPVIAEETGFSELIPAGRGLLAFRDLEEAAAAVAEIDAHYEFHRRAARELAEAHFDARRTLERMLAASSA